MTRARGFGVEICLACAWIGPGVRSFASHHKPLRKLPFQRPLSQLPHLKPQKWRQICLPTQARSFSLGSVAQEAVNISTGIAAFAAKAYGLALLLVFLLQRKLIFLPSKDVADPRAYGKMEVIQLSGPNASAAIFFKPQPSKPTIVPPGCHVKVSESHSFHADVSTCTHQT